MRVARMLAVAIVACSTVLGACSHAFRQPQVTLTGLTLGGIGLKGGLVYADVAVKNPNHYTLETNRITYDLRVQDPNNANNWLPFTTGAYTDLIKVGSGQTTTLQVPIQFSFNTASAAVQSVMNSGIFNYRVAGEVHVTEPITRTVPYQHQGVVSMAGAR